MNELLKKGAEVRITKKQTLKSPGEQFTIEEGKSYVGELQHDVEVGKPIYVRGSHLHEWVLTTTVQKIDGNELHTRNSIWVVSKP